jgi:hypothetical protein
VVTESAPVVTSFCTCVDLQEKGRRARTRAEGRGDAFLFNRLFPKCPSIRESTGASLHPHEIEET